MTDTGTVLVDAEEDVTLAYEDLARRAQQFLSERPVVVLGTGATIPHGLPSMTALADHLLGTIPGTTPGWDAFSQRLDETKDLEQSLQDVPLPADTVELLVSATWKIVSAKDLEFYGRLVQGPEPFPLADLFKYLLRTADSHIQVVTTNYDRLAEYAANRVGAYVSTGVTTGWMQRFVPAAANAEKSPAPGYDGQVALLKVHGSLDWFSDTTGDILGVPLASEIPENMKALVVTPGVSKYREVHKDPFRTVMSAADSVLRKAKCYLCVGYGFNDEHVEPVLMNRVLKNDIPLVVVTKALTTRTRDAFLSAPPKKFLLLEETDGGGGTTVYDPEHPAGVDLDGISVWKLDSFMGMIAGEGAR
jgi:hypothetical protein